MAKASLLQQGKKSENKTYYYQYLPFDVSSLAAAPLARSVIDSQQPFKPKENVLSVSQMFCDAFMHIKQISDLSWAHGDSYILCKVWE